MKEKKKLKLKISKNQMNRLRIIYAFVLATRYYGLKPSDVFENQLNPEWIRLKDLSLENWDGTLQTWQTEQLEQTGKTDFGCFKIRKTKKGYIIYADLVRLRK